MKLAWYWSRLRCMSTGEILARTQAAARQKLWAYPALRPRFDRHQVASARPPIALPHPPAAVAQTQAAQRLLDFCDGILAGHWPLFSTERHNIGPAPDWFLDPVTGIRAPQHPYCFSVPHRDEATVGNIKYVWEPSRHQTTTQLAAAWWISGKEEYATRVAAHLTSWWEQNPFLSGVHWSSGIELGLRLLSWAWIRALLSEWSGCKVLFDDNPTFHAQLFYHQKYLEHFQSVGSSANNHLIAEVMGLATAASVFPWFPESRKWRTSARAALMRAAEEQTAEDGWNREQASDYHLFVLDMLLSAAMAAELVDDPYPARYFDVIARMCDALAASLDTAGLPPLFGDSDEGQALCVDHETDTRASSLLDAAAAFVGRPAWWSARPPQASVRADIAAQIAHEPRVPANRACVGPLFPASGHAFLRSQAGGQDIWMRCDHGPLGYLSTAAHGHADALNVELRIGGVEILADPGTYCYHGEPEWRRYFKGTLGHNTLSIDGHDQARYAGPFMWLDRVDPALDHFDAGAGSGQWIWQAHIPWKTNGAVTATHHRRIAFDRRTSRLTMTDWVSANGAVPATLSFHFGPMVAVELSGFTAKLSWPARGGQMQASLNLPASLQWSLLRGRAHPPAGWYSGHFGDKTASFTLQGHGPVEPDQELETSFLLVMANDDVRSPQLA